MDYGKIAVSVVEKYKPGQDIRQCWECEFVGVTDKESSIKKSCPLSAFLGLCEAGYIKGIPKGKYTKSYKNKKYAVVAADIVLAGDNVNHDPDMLWQKLKEYIPDRCDTPNSQVNIVLALKEASFLQKPE
ncbi:MAG: hypothetical protein ABN480_15250 [Dickeya sp.]